MRLRIRYLTACLSTGNLPGTINLPSGNPELTRTLGRLHKSLYRAEGLAKQFT